MRTGLPIPQRIQNAPVLHMGSELYLVGFLDLNGSRNVGMSAGPIPWGAVHDYCFFLGLDAEQTDDMHYHIGRLDAVWNDYHSDKEEPSSG